MRIDPAGKRVLVLANQGAGKDHLGDYGEITGQVDTKAQTVHVDSVKFLEKGAARCEAKPRESSK